VIAMTLDEAVAAFKRELPNWWWSVAECHVSVHGGCGPGWPAYQNDPRDEYIDALDIELDKPSGPRGGEGPDPTPADLIMALIKAAKAARAAREAA
jgi:hypothetical protein